jgi:hypothetical protein
MIGAVATHRRASGVCRCPAVAFPATWQVFDAPVRRSVAPLVRYLSRYLSCFFRASCT